MSRFIRTDVSSGRIHFLSFMLLILSGLFALLFVANMGVLFVATDKTLFVVQAPILFVLALLSFAGSQALRRLAQARSPKSG